jgi:molybdopterin/thiamine biosynthesis adenylyltransferase
MSSDDLPPLTDAELARYEWQMWTRGIGKLGQRKLKAASVLISRIGGVGGTAALHLAAAGVGRLILAHAGDIRLSDLNRQLLMSTPALGQPRIASARERLQALNPLVEVRTIPANVGPDNAEQLVAQADVVIDAAPRFEERFLLNAAAVRQGKALVEAAMYDFDGQLTTILPGNTGCLRCLYPESPAHWRREFPVFGAVAGTIGSLAAVETIKLITGVGEPLAGVLLQVDLRAMRFLRLPFGRNPHCPVCGAADA